MGDVRAKPCINLGILAHIDAGKTTLTERLLFNAGEIAEMGSVDTGTTQTDSDAIERERGITIRAAIRAFETKLHQFNIIDTPGHPDFIAEVERSLAVLDMAILVVSAVEGVQAQTRVLMKALAHMSIATAIFINKVDRGGALEGDVAGQIRRWLSPNIVTQCEVVGAGTKQASLRPARPHDLELAALADQDEALSAAYINDELTDRQLKMTTRAAFMEARAYPVFYGSAVTGLGCEELVQGIEALWVAPTQRPAELSALAFAVERNAQRTDRSALVRIFSGTLEGGTKTSLRREGADPVPFRPGRLQLVTPQGKLAGSQRGEAGEVVRVFGSELKIGDSLGEEPPARGIPGFPPPFLTSEVRAVDTRQAPDVFAALVQIADEDPMVMVAPGDEGSTRVSMYGEVQRQVLKARLEQVFGLATTFSDVKVTFSERLRNSVDVGSTYEPTGPNEHWISLRFGLTRNSDREPNVYRVETQFGDLPNAYYRAIEESALGALDSGPRGWPVKNVMVTLTFADFDPPMSNASDFRQLTRRLIRQGLQEGGTTIWEPTYEVSLELPTTALNASLALAHRYYLNVAEINDDDVSRTKIEGFIPVRTFQDFIAEFPRVTAGQGICLTSVGRDVERH